MKKMMGMLILVVIFNLTGIVSLAGDDRPEITFTQTPARYAEYKRTALETTKPLAGIENITINKEKNIAIAFRNGTILIYDQSGKYKSGFSFENNGAFIIHYSDVNASNLDILMHRDEVAYIVDEKGMLIETKGWEIKEESNYYKQKQFVIDQEIYEISNAAFWPILPDAGSKVVKKTADKEILIYSNLEYPIFVTINTIILMCVVGIIIYIMMREGLKNNSKRKKHGACLK